MERNPLHPKTAGPVAFVLPHRWRRTLRGLALAGVLGTLLGWIFDRGRICPAMLMAGFYAIGIGLGGVLFIAFSYVTKAGWSVALRRVPEAMAATLPVGAALMVLALLGAPWLYEWTHEGVVEGAKAAWFDTGSFMARAMIYLLVWLLLGAAIRAVSVRQDRTGDVAATARNTTLSAIFLVVFAITFTLACFDWLMSLEPHWYSTVFAVYNFSGLFVGALATMTVLIVALRRLGPLEGIVKPDHLHDIGKLTFGFATFWAYIWYCQHMLIWYGNLPEETGYFALRQSGAWGPLMVLNPVVNWLIPFLVLLPRPSKRSESVMLNVALLLLAGRWLDLYVMVQPPSQPGGPRFGIWEIAPMLAALSLVALALFRALGKANLLPRHDPMLVESLHHRI